VRSAQRESRIPHFLRVMAIRPTHRPCLA
jgi:hypothetical protein